MYGLGLSGRHRSDTGEVHYYTASFSDTHTYRLHIDNCFLNLTLSFKDDSVVFTIPEHKHIQFLVEYIAVDHYLKHCQHLGDTNQKTKSRFFPDYQLNVILHRLLNVFTMGHSLTLKPI